MEVDMSTYTIILYSLITAIAIYLIYSDIKTMYVPLWSLLIFGFAIFSTQLMGMIGLHSEQMTITPNAIHRSSQLWLFRLLIVICLGLIAWIYQKIAKEYRLSTHIGSADYIICGFIYLQHGLLSLCFILFIACIIFIISYLIKWSIYQLQHHTNISKKINRAPFLPYLLPIFIFNMWFNLI